MDNMTAEVRSDMNVETSERSVTSYQAFDVLTLSHTELGEDLTLKNTEIAQPYSCCACSEIKLEASQLTDKLHSTEVKLHDITVLYQNSQKSLLEAKERLEQCDKEMEGYRQCITDMKLTVEGLQQELQHGMQREEARMMESRRQVKTLQKEVQNLKEIVKTKEGIIAQMLEAKEENIKTAVALQLQAEHLTSVKVQLEQQIGDLEGKNSSLQNELRTMTDSYKHHGKLVMELELHVDQLRANEQKLSEQLSLSSLLCEQKDEFIWQLKSEKEELSRSLVALTHKAEADPIERTAHTKHVSELEEQISAVRSQMEQLCAEKQALADELKICRELQKCELVQNSDAAAASEKSHVEPNLHPSDCISVHDLINLSLELDSGNSGDCQSLDINLQEMCEPAETEDPAYSNTRMDITNETEIVTGDDASSATEKVPSAENVNKVNSSKKSEDIMSENAEIQQNKLLESSVKQASERMSESDSLTENPTKVSLSEKSEKMNLRPVMSDNVETQQSEQLESSAKEALKTEDEIVNLPTGVTITNSTAHHSDHSSAMGCERSAQVFNSHESTIHIVKDGSISKESSSTEKVACSKDLSVKVMEGGPIVAVADAVSKMQDLDMQGGGGERRRVIKRFTRPSQSFCELRLGSDACRLATQPASLNFNVNGHNAVDMAITQSPADKPSPVSEESPETRNEVTCAAAAAESEDSTGNIPAAVAADCLPSSQSVCLVNAATEATNSKLHSVCNQLSFPQVANDSNNDGNGCFSHPVAHSLDHLTGDGSLFHPDFSITRHVPASICSEPNNIDLQLVDPNAGPLSTDGGNVIGSNDNSSDNKSGLCCPTLYPSCKRLNNVDVIADDTKKLRLG